ncbi:hypothetical protein ACQJBY_061619 [Aegilops geniculata]
MNIQQPRQICRLKPLPRLLVPASVRPRSFPVGSGVIRRKEPRRGDLLLPVAMDALFLFFRNEQRPCPLTASPRAVPSLLSGLLAQGPARQQPPAPASLSIDWARPMGEQVLSPDRLDADRYVFFMSLRI